MLSAPLLLPSYYSSWPSLVSDFGFDMPRSSIDQTDSAVNFELAVPGFKDDEVHVSVDGNLLRVHAEHQDRRQDEQRDAQGRVITRSKYQSSSSIHESFRLPSGLRLDNMTKEVSNGMLKVSIPKLAITDRPQQQQQQQQPQQQPQQQQQQQQQQLLLQGSQSQPQQQPQGSQAGDKQQELVGQAQQEHKKAEGGLRQREGEARPRSSSLTMMNWPPHIETHESGNQLEYIISLPNVRKENVRLNVEHNQLYLSIVEHDEGHTFDNCGSCVSQRQRGDEFEKRQGSTQRGGIGHDSQQRQKDELVRGECSRYSERSCTFRLPYGTACEDVEARFDNNKLVVRVQRKRRGWGGVNIQ